MLIVVLPGIEVGAEVAVVGVITTGQGPIAVPWDNLGPTKFPWRVPPAMIVYVTPQPRPSNTTSAIRVSSDTSAITESVNIQRYVWAIDNVMLLKTIIIKYGST